jgi:hypothetical protein
MSSKYVRDLVRGWAAGSPTPYYDTINLDNDPADVLWFTIMFEVEESSKTTFCGDTEEAGVIELVFCGRAGVGDANALAAAEAEGVRLMALADPGARLTLRRAMPPEEHSAGDGDPFYRVVVGLEYDYRA